MLLFKAADWCLRFRYFTETPVSMDVIIWDLIADRNLSLVEIRNSTYKSSTNTIWHLVEWNIDMTNDFKVIVLSSEHKKTLQNDLLLLKKILTNYKLEFIIL